MTANQNDGVFLSARVTRRDLVHALYMLTLHNHFFDVSQWSEAEIVDVRTISRFLDESLAELKKHLADKQLSSGENHPALTKA